MMKRSNIIILSAVILTISWLLISGWMQANAYKIIKSGKSCSYAGIINPGYVQQLHSFKNIKVDFEKKSLSPRLVIRYGKKQELSCSNSLKKNISYNVSGDTLYLRINYLTWNSDDYFNLSVPLLKSVNITSASDWSGYYDNFKNNITISGFRANTLSVNYNCQLELVLENNKLKKLEIRGDFRKNGEVKISNYADYDSLDVDIEGKYGTLIMSQSSQIKENSKQWISIKLHKSFRIVAPADVLMVSKIAIKK